VSDTPRTDAEAFAADDACYDVVQADFVRDLERENTALREAARRGVEAMADEDYLSASEQFERANEWRKQSEQMRERAERAEAALAAAVARELKWKQMAEYQYAKTKYPDELELGQGALDAYIKNWRWEDVLARADQPEYTTDALDEVLRGLGEPKQGEKTVSAVEAMQKAHDALMALRTMTKAHPALHGREYIDLGIQMNNAIDGLDAAIKAAQQPVGYDTLPDSKFDAKFKHVGVSPHAPKEAK
jgi:hypothetical protein